MRRFVVTLGALKAVCLVAIWFLLRWVAEPDIGVTASAVLIVVPLVLVVPVSRGGHAMLDAHPDRVVAVTAGVDTILIVLFGLAVVEGVRSTMLRPGWRLPIPAELGLVLMWFLGPIVALTVANLALRGLGAPFAAPISSRLATDWMYRYTRNPMVLSLLLFLVAVALWLRSAWCVAWAMGLVAPAWFDYPRIFEERELELRFGPSYLEDRARTPMLWPTGSRRPQPE